MFDLNREAGTALVVVTHDMELATRCQQVVRLKGGRVVEGEEEGKKGGEEEKRTGGDEVGGGGVSERGGTGRG